MKLSEKLSKLVTNQSQIARKTGLSQSAISEATAGKRRLYLDQAFLLAQALGVSLDYLADDRQQEPVSGDGLTDDERFVIQIYRDLRITRQEAVRRLACEVGGKPISSAESQTVRELDTSEAMKREEKRRLGFELESETEVSCVQDLPPAIRKP